MTKPKPRPPTRQRGRPAKLYLLSSSEDEEEYSTEPDGSPKTPPNRLASTTPSLPPSGAPLTPRRSALFQMGELAVIQYEPRSRTPPPPKRGRRANHGQLRFRKIDYSVQGYKNCGRVPLIKLPEFFELQVRLEKYKYWL
jgi:hypothetical protein